MTNRINSLLASIEFDIGQEGREQLPFGETVVTENGGASVVAGFISNLFRISIVVAALILLFNLIFAGFEWLSSGGDSSKIEKARSRMTQSIIGFVILFAVIAIFSFIQDFLGINVITFTNQATSPSQPPPGGGGGGERLPIYPF